MLPKFLRLTRLGFENTRSLRRTHTANFSISYGTLPEGGSAVIVPKKAIKSAVKRHLMKRRVRAIMRPWSTKDRVLIITARASAANLSYKELEDELSLALNDILGKPV